jgi:uncharacterized membrane protein YtjA (UPF0391 family)
LFLAAKLNQPATKGAVTFERRAGARQVLAVRRLMRGNGWGRMHVESTSWHMFVQDCGPRSGHLNGVGVRRAREKNMFRYAIIFAVVALIAALLGFGGIAGLSAEFAKILLIVAAVLFVVGMVFGRGRRTIS